MANDYTNYTVNMPHQAAWLVYINGVEVPVVSVDVDFGVWSIPEVRLTMVPHVSLQRIGFEDRLQVSVWYLDEWFDPNNPEFKILGEFEVVGWSYTNSGTSRYIELKCRAHTQIMEQLHFYYMSAVDDIVTGLSPATGQNPNLYSQAMVYYPASLFLHGLVKSSPVGSVATATGTAGTTTDTPATAAEQALAVTSNPAVAPENFVRSPFEFVSNVFKALLTEIDTSKYTSSSASAGKLPADAASVPGRNFFARWMNFTDFRRRWAGLPFFDDAESQTMDGCFPLIKAVQSTEVLSALQQQLGQSVGQAGSVWDLLRSIYSTMYMEIVTLPAPPAVSIEKGTGQLKGAIRRKKGGTVIRNSSKEFGGILHHIVKPQCIFGIPPTCNIIFPSMIKDYTFQEDYMSQPTRMYLGEKYMSNILSAGATGSPQALVGELLTTGYPPVVRKRMELYIADPKQNTKNFLIYPEELYKGPITAQKNAPPWLWMLEQKYKAVQQTAYKTGDWKKMGRRKTKEAIKPIVAKYAGKLNLPAAMVFALVERESGFVADNVAWDGGGGLMQMQIAGDWTHPNTGKTKRTVDSVGTAYRLAKRKLGWGGRKLSQINRLDPDDNLKLGISLLHHYMITRPKKVTGKPGVPSDLDNENTKRGILAFKYGASDGSKLWKFTFKPGDDNVYSSKGVLDKTATRSWKRWKKAYLKYAGMDLTPSANTANAAENAAQVEPEETTAEPQTTTTTPAEDALQSVFTAERMAEGREGPLGKLFQLYARYELYRTRFESRAGGVTMAFNPYIVPGFPAVIFDEKTSGFDTFGYVTKVKHRLSVMSGSPTMITTANFTFSRSFAEFVKYLRQGVEEATDEGDVANYDCGPSEPIPSVAEAFQLKDNAESFYGDVFYAGTKKQTVFDWEKVVSVVDIEGNPLAVTEGGFQYEQGLILKPKAEYYSEFRSADAAMFYIARPVCTLRDYVELRHGKDIKTLTEEGTVVKGMDTSYYSELRAGGKGAYKGGAVFWGRIDAYIQGPGNPDDETIQRVTNMGIGPDYMPNMDGSWDIITASKGIPQTRQNWDKALRRYRAIVRSEGKHSAPQV